MSEKSKAEVEVRIAEFVPALQAFLDAHYGAAYQHVKAPKISLQKGPKYIRVVSTDSQASVYCFLDWQGNIYKAESWKKPAKHVRGSIFDDNFSLGKSLGWYGAKYLNGPANYGISP